MINAGPGARHTGPGTVAVAVTVTLTLSPPHARPGRGGGGRERFDGWCIVEALPSKKLSLAPIPSMRLHTYYVTTHPPPFSVCLRHTSSTHKSTPQTTDPSAFIIKFFQAFTYKISNSSSLRLFFSHTLGLPPPHHPCPPPQSTPFHLDLLARVHHPGGQCLGTVA